MLGAMTVSVQRFGHVGIRVHDLQRALSFYEVLGFHLVAGPIGPEPVAILENEAGLELNLILNADPDAQTNLLMDVDVKHPGLTHVAFVVPDLDAAQATLREAGLVLSGGPVRLGNRVRAVFVRDPDHNVIELDEFVSPP
jgi:lactoylglutathione lyase